MCYTTIHCIQTLDIGCAWCTAHNGLSTHLLCKRTAVHGSWQNCKGTLCTFVAAKATQQLTKHTWIRSENAAGPPCGRNTSSQPENPIRPTSFLNQTNNDKTQQTCKPDKTVSVRVPKLWGVYYAQVSAHLSTAASGCRIKP